MRVIYKRSGGSTNRGHNMILLTRRETKQTLIEFSNTASRAISGSLGVKVGVYQAQLVTFAQVQYLV